MFVARLWMPAPLVTVTLSLCLAAQPQSPASESQTEYRFQRTLQQQVDVGYLLYLPPGYDEDESRKWPLIFFLHGAGERGDDLNQLKRHGPPRIVDGGKDLPFVILSPQCPRNRVWSSVPLLALLDEIVANHRVDPERIYLTGLSMGGYGTWELAARAPERFAAIAPICGGGMRIFVLTLRNLPIWAFHGGRDLVVPLDESERMVEALTRRGHQKVRLTVYPEAGHDSWTEAYNDPELYQWFFSHSLSDR